MLQPRVYDSLFYGVTFRMKFRYLAFVLAISVSSLAQTPQSAQPLPDAPSTTSQIKPPVVPTGPTAVIDTTMGRLTCKLYDKEAPITVANFIGLAEGTKDWTDDKTLQKMHHQPFYNGTTFHRVIPGFMIQGGDPTGTGAGGTDVIKDEFDPSLKFDQPGRLAMANAGPHTGSCQFFITEVATPHLNGLHPIFGQVVEHQELVSTITHVAKNAEGRPKTPVVIKKVAFERWQNGKEAPLFPAAAPAAKAGVAKKAPATAPAKAPAKK